MSSSEGERRVSCRGSRAASAREGLENGTSHCIDLVMAAGTVLVGAGVYRLAPRHSTHPDSDGRTPRVVEPGESPETRGPGGAGGPAPAGGGRNSPFITGMRYRPACAPIDQGGFKAAIFAVEPWKPDASLREIAEHWGRPGHRGVEIVDRQLAIRRSTATAASRCIYLKATLLGYEGEAERAYKVLEELRSFVEGDRLLAQATLGTVIYLQGVMALRRGVWCNRESLFPGAQFVLAASAYFPQATPIRLPMGCSNYENG